MSTQTPSAVNPGAAMADFIGDLKAAGMAEAIAPVEAPKDTPPPEKPPEAPPETKPEVKLDPAAKPAPESEEDKWPRSVKDWDAFKAKRKERETALRTERDTIKAERDKLNSEIEALKKSGPSPELDGLKKERDQLSDQLRIVSVENHPKFKAYFENKTNAQIELAKRVVGGEHAEKMVALLQAQESPMRDQQIDDLISTMTPIQQSRIGSVLNSLAEIQHERQSEISKAKENYDKMQKEQQDQVAANTNKFKGLVEDTIRKASDPKEGNPIFQTRDGDEAWNAEVKQRVEASKNLLFGNPSHEQIARAALDAVAYPAILKQAQAVMKENDTLKAQVAELSKAQPTVQAKQGEKDNSANPQNHVAKPGSSPAETLSGWIKNLSAGQG